VHLLQWTDTVWYSTIPLGVNTLSTVVSRLCKIAGFSGYFTLHSLRATAVTRLFAADVDERLIMAQTGHTSNAVRSYKQFSERQLQHVSDVVAGRRSVLSAKPEDVNDQVMMAQTGHLSTDVCSYKQISDQQLPHESDVVACTKPVLSAEPLSSVPLELSLVPSVSLLSCPASLTASVSCETCDSAPDGSGHVLSHDNTGNMTVNILCA